jgi:hypothetical protein
MAFTATGELLQTRKPSLQALWSRILELDAAQGLLSG